MNTEKYLNNEKMALLLSKSRTKAGFTQKHMAKSLGKSVTTIKNWESGIGCPSFLDTLEWFDVVEMNVEKAILDFAYPQHFSQINQNTPAENVKKALTKYINEVLTDEEVRKLHYCMLGETGSSFHAQLELWNAHNHTTLKSRVNVARSVLDNYEMEEERNELINMENARPNIDRLRNAIELGKIAAKKSSNAYTDF